MQWMEISFALSVLDLVLNIEHGLNPVLRSSEIKVKYV